MASTPAIKKNKETKQPAHNEGTIAFRLKSNLRVAGNPHILYYSFNGNFNLYIKMRKKKSTMDMKRVNVNLFSSKIFFVLSNYKNIISH